jgi:hypothetical protein
VGCADGRLRIVQTDGGLLDANLQLSQPVRALAWNPLGHWVVASGNALRFFSDVGQPIGSPLALPDGAPEALAISVDGLLAACRSGDHQVQVVDLSRRQMVARVTYERGLGELAFGPGRWLGVGLVGGDGNKIHLATGAVHRTDTFAHRGHNSWILIPEINTDACAQADASVVPAPAPGSPIGPGKAGHLRTILWVLAGLVLLGLVGYLTVLKTELRDDARRQENLKAEIRASIQRSVRDSIDAQP